MIEDEKKFNKMDNHDFDMTDNIKELLEESRMARYGIEQKTSANKIGSSFKLNSQNSLEEIAKKKQSLFDIQEFFSKNKIIDSYLANEEYNIGDKSKKSELNMKKKANEKELTIEIDLMKIELNNLKNKCKDMENKIQEDKIDPNSSALFADYEIRIQKLNEEIEGIKVGMGNRENNIEKEKQQFIDEQREKIQNVYLILFF